ncbi:MAG: hypothetical protein ABS955_09045 [Stenotrophomonas maltophilia]
MKAVNRGQLAYERALIKDGDAVAMARYLATPFVYRRNLSPDAQAIQAASGQSDTVIKADGESGESTVTILPGFVELTGISKTFPGCCRMELGAGGDLPVIKAIFHEHDHVEDRDAEGK